MSSGLSYTLNTLLIPQSCQSGVTMSCNTCQTKFAFFTRENACPGCRFSYCGKCLKYKFDLPHIGVKKICGKCYFRLKDQHENLAKDPSGDNDGQDMQTDGHVAEEIAPVDITQKLNSLENPSKPPIVLYKQEVGRWERLKSGLDLPDQEIVDRLRKLKKEDKPIPQPSLEEIRKRLALLKDQDPDKPVPKTNIHEVDLRTDEQKSADLINEYLEELELSSEENTDSKIEERLARLRGIDPEKFRARNEAIKDDEDEQEATKKIIKKALAEATLEKKYSDLEELELMDTDPSEEQEDELPWCTICNEDARLRCLGCDGDLYCLSCFKQGHDSFDMEDHQTETYKPKPK